MTDRPTPAGPERVAYRGEIVSVVEQPMAIGGDEMVFEVARRAPGTRVIVDRGSEILLTEEYRHEIGDLDYRLPGGKVYDTLDAYEAALDADADVDAAAREAARQEASEEAGLDIGAVEPFDRLHAGATVEWDLYYFVTTEFETTGQDLERGEEIETHWLETDRVRRLVLDGEVREGRTAAVLLRYLDGE